MFVLHFCHHFLDRNLPNVVNESILKALKWKNAELDAEVFGGKSKLQYKPKQAVKSKKVCF